MFTWTTKDGRVLTLNQMTDRHVWNCYKLCESRDFISHLNALQLLGDGPNGDFGFFEPISIPTSETTQQFIDELRRRGLPLDQVPPPDSIWQTFKNRSPKDGLKFLFHKTKAWMRSVYTSVFNTRAHRRTVSRR